jgi:hypothetical protein
MTLAGAPTYMPISPVNGTCQAVVAWCAHLGNGKMKGYFRVLMLVLNVWVYGSEALDTLIEQSEWVAFSAKLQCETRDEHVWCKVDGKWETIDNKPLLVPWGLE